MDEDGEEMYNCLICMSTRMGKLIIPYDEHNVSVLTFLQQILRYRWIVSARQFKAVGIRQRQCSGPCYTRQPRWRLVIIF